MGPCVPVAAGMDFSCFVRVKRFWASQASPWRRGTGFLWWELWGCRVAGSTWILYSGNRAALGSRAPVPSLMQVGGLGQGPEWSNSRKALQDVVEQELAALQGSWEQCSTPAQPQRPHRLVRSKDGAPRPQGLQAAEMIRTLNTKKACLEKVLHRLQHQCRQELARLAGTPPGLIWILPPGH